MKNRKLWMITAVIAAALLMGIIALAWANAKDKGTARKAAPEETVKNTAMYVSYGEGDYIMVDQESGSVFTVTMPENMKDANSSDITEKDLRSGNILDIYGNGIMLESYPGQYPGVSRIEVAKEGTPSDADKYQSLIDQIYQEPDPSKRPFLDVEYRTKDALVTSVTTPGGYEWSYTDRNGQKQSEATDAAHITQWNEIADLNVGESADLTLVFSSRPEKVRVQIWPSGSRENASDLPDGSDADVLEQDGTYIIKEAQPGYLYLVTADWENGYTEYGFLTK